MQGTECWLQLVGKQRRWSDDAGTSPCALPCHDTDPTYTILPLDKVFVHKAMQDFFINNITEALAVFERPRQTREACLEGSKK